MRLKGEYEVRTGRRGALHRAAAAQSRHIPSAVAAVAKRRGGANANAEAKAVRGLQAKLRAERLRRDEAELKARARVARGIPQGPPWRAQLC